MHEAEYVIHLGRAHLGPEIGQRSHRNESNQYRRHFERPGSGSRCKSETHRFRRFVFRVRRDAYPAQDRDNGTAADLSIRCHKICRRVVRTDFRPVLWARERFASLLQYFRTSPGTQLSIFRCARQILHGFPGRHAADDFWRRRANPRFHLRGKCGASQLAGLRSA